MPEARVINCPECDSRIRISVRDSGEVTVLDSQKADPLEDLREL